MEASKGEEGAKGLLKKSEWARLYDWEWAREPPLWGQDAYAAHRAEVFPPTFFYHVLRGFRRVSNDDPDGDGTEDMECRCVSYSEFLSGVLNAFTTPTTFVDYVRQSCVAVTPAIRAVQLLRREGLIVPADLDEPIDCAAVFDAAACAYGLFQHSEEMVPVLELLAPRQPKVVVEIGTAWGGSLFCWAQIADPEANLISIDLPGGRGGGGHTARYVRHYQQFCGPSQRLSSVLGDSSHPDVIQQARHLVGDQPVDLLYIDGDHTYEGVVRDFENYSPLVVPGGLILFHDIMPAPNHAECIEVDVLWEELKPRYRFQEFVRDPEQEGSGIGVLYV